MKWGLLCASGESGAEHRDRKVLRLTKYQAKLYIFVDIEQFTSTIFLSSARIVGRSWAFLYAYSALIQHPNPRARAWTARWATVAIKRDARQQYHT